MSIKLDLEKPRGIVSLYLNSHKDMMVNKPKFSFFFFRSEQNKIRRRVTSFFLEKNGDPAQGNHKYSSYYSNWENSNQLTTNLSYSIIIWLAGSWVGTLFIKDPLLFLSNTKPTP